MPRKDFGRFKDGFKMNVFVLCTGRCGSMTFAKACGHISNYTSAHESSKQLKPKVPRECFVYSDFHIEVDNRLAWFLGALNQIYGANAFYVHLKREMEGTVRSQYNHKHCITYLQRWHKGIMKSISDEDRLNLCMKHYNIVNKNISKFLEDKTKKMDFSLENSKQDFVTFWNKIKAKGNLKRALKEWDTKYNATKR